jgi:putative transposase
VQALCQKFAANVAAATELRKQEFAETGPTQTAYPHHHTPYQTVICKDQALQVLPQGQLRLPCGGCRGCCGCQRVPLLLPLPEQYRTANLRRAELTWRADHSELALTVDTGNSLPAPLAGGAVVMAGVDLGEVHLAALTTTHHRHPPPLTATRSSSRAGTCLRACTQGRHRAHPILQNKLSHCQRGSRRWRHLTTRKVQASAQLSRQQREILPQAARKAVVCCQAAGVTRCAVGAVRDIQRGAAWAA